MKPHVNPIERAFELARSGSCRSTTEIKSALKSEGYSTETLTGGSLLKQLRTIISTNHEDAAAPSLRS